LSMLDLQGIAKVAHYPTVVVRRIESSN